MIRPVAPLSVLIVEDEALLAMDLEAMVLDTGHAVVAEATSLEDVARLGDELRPAIAFVDVQLAHNSLGTDVVELIRQRWPETVIVFVTANPSKVPREFGGAHGLIAKPFSRAGLTAAMRWIAEGVIDPPPSFPQPEILTTSAAMAASWAAFGAAARAD